jgi:hypothetical protein
MPSKKKTKKKKRKSTFSKISDHKKQKGKLISPLSQLNLKITDWERDLMPEHLWIDCLANSFSEKVWPELYNLFLDELDKYAPEGIVLFGFITDFGLIPVEKRKDFIKKNEKLIYDIFYKPIGRIMAFYPESPCNWLINKKWIEKEGSLDPDVELSKLNKSIIRLLPAKDLYAGNIRAVPLNRMFKHNKIKIFKDLPVAELLPKYPTNCTEEEQYRVQQFVRMQMNIFYEQFEHYRTRAWPKYFWRHNFDIVPCIPYEFDFVKEASLNEEDISKINNLLKENIENVIQHLDMITNRYRYDLYNPERDEILLGLFSRLTRLYVLIAINPNFWSRDISGILLRCLADTAITFSYLVKKGTDEDFENFKSYGEGKEKLLMLHLQDTYPEVKSLENQSPEEIAQDLGGGLIPELIDIELANWTKKNVRDLAFDAGLEKYYRLIYDPASPDIHGTWMSLKKTNLVRCSQPLHRFHRIPAYFEPPLLVDIVDVAQEIYSICLTVGTEFLKFPQNEKTLNNINSLLQSKKNT